jgi:hypothetical protein
LCTVVRHFLVRWRDDMAAADQLAYFEGYAAAIQAAPKHELAYPCGWRWYEDLRDCLRRCVTVLREQQQTQRRQEGPLQALPPISRRRPARASSGSRGG